MALRPSLFDVMMGDVSLEPLGAYNGFQVVLWWSGMSVNNLNCCDDGNSDQVHILLQKNIIVDLLFNAIALLFIFRIGQENLILF